MPAPAPGALLGEWTAKDLLLADSTPISTWPEHGGTGRDLLAAGGVRPLLRTGVFNGFQAVRYDGVDDVLATTATWNVPLAHSLYVVFQYVVNPPALFKTPLFSFAAPNNWHAIGKTAGQQHIAEITRGGGAQQFQRARSWVVRAVDPTVWGQSYDGGGTIATLFPLVNGLTDLYTTLTNVGPPVGQLTASIMQQPANVPLNMDAAHIFAYSRPLTSRENYDLHQYIQNEWTVPNCASDLIPTGAQTLFGVASPGGPGASITVARPAGVVSGVQLVVMMNLSRDSADAPYVITPPADVAPWVARGQLQNDQAFMAIFTKTAGGAEPANYTFGISPATNRGGDIHCDSIGPASLIYQTNPIVAVALFPKGSGFSGGPPVTTTNWNVALPGVAPLSRWIIKVGSDGRVSTPDWAVPSHYLEDTAIAAASSFQRRSGGIGGRTDVITASVGAMGIVGAVAVGSLEGASPAVSNTKRMRMGFMLGGRRVRQHEQGPGGGAVPRGF